MAERNAPPRVVRMVWVETRARSRAASRSCRSDSIPRRVVADPDRHLVESLRGAFGRELHGAGDRLLFADDRLRAILVKIGRSFLIVSPPGKAKARVERSAAVDERGQIVLARIDLAFDRLLPVGRVSGVGGIGRGNSRSLDPAYLELEEPDPHAQARSRPVARLDETFRLRHPGVGAPLRLAVRPRIQPSERPALPVLNGGPVWIEEIALVEDRVGNLVHERGVHVSSLLGQPRPGDRRSRRLTCYGFSCNASGRARGRTMPAGPAQPRPPLRPAIPRTARGNSSVPRV